MAHTATRIARDYLGDAEDAVIHEAAQPIEAFLRSREGQPWSLTGDEIGAMLEKGRL